MSARNWWRLPWPAAVALAVLMPWRAVALIRELEDGVRILAWLAGEAESELEEIRAG